jgi:SAM-dependent methyltransferase
MPLYTEDFYRNIHQSSHRSAKEIVPLIIELMQPRSVIDIGCGVGTWLAVFKEYGIEDIFGVDGNYVDKKLLEIPEENFLSFDLEKPFRMDRQFDLVVSLEVAEHLPGSCAEIFIDSLTSLGPVILFSAAIPFQGGEYHVNEQWPDYWAKLFQKKGYVIIDYIRNKIWQNEAVEWYYAQNILIFAKEHYIGNHDLLKIALTNTLPLQLSIVYPKKYLEVIDWLHCIHDMARLIPSETPFILVDQEQLRNVIAVGRHAIPFLERDGQYWGPPPNDMTAILELERLHRSGARFIVFAWPAFWWLEYYAELHRHLHSEFRCVLQNDRLIVFDLC